MIKYRPEIDGLRAIAVLSVVIYHARFSLGDSILLSGGYLGVDIFFVISGFLITSIILKSLSQGQFSFVDFYQRRARRILPALFIVITCSIPFAWWLMLPEDMQQYAGSVLSSLLFSSNIWFFLEDSYTAEPSLLKPFLHTWSLSVEEQFYLFFPILLLVIWRFSKKTSLVIYVGLLLVSLIAAEWASKHYVDANFYLLPTRMWELIGGALLALSVNSRSSAVADQSPGSKNTGLMWLGTALVLIPIVIFTENTRHPSLYTVAPVLGTMIIMHFAHPSNFLTQILSNGVFVTIGKWSYSLYLWHFPIFAFARIHSDSISVIEKLIYILLSIALAAISYRWIEQPFRNKDKFNFSLFVKIIVTWFIALCAVFAYIYHSKGVPERLGPLQTIFSESQLIPVMKDGRGCHQRPSDNACVFLGDKKTMIIDTGDSHANAQATTLKNLAEKYQMGFMQLSEDACPLIKGVVGFRDGTRIGNCHTHSQAKRLAKINQFENSIVIYNGRFPYYLSRETFDNQLGGKEVGPISWMSPSLQGEHNNEFMISKVQETINDMLDQGHVVAIIYPVPEAAWDIPKMINQKLSTYNVGSKLGAFKELEIATSYRVYLERTQSTYDMFDAIDDRPNLVRIYPSELLCDETANKCYTHNSEAIYYQDDDHLSPYGAQLVTDSLEQKLIEIVSDMKAN